MQDTQIATRYHIPVCVRAIANTADIVADMVLDADGSACLLNCLSYHKTDVTALRGILSLMCVLRTGTAPLSARMSCKSCTWSCMWGEWCGCWRVR